MTQSREKKEETVEMGGEQLESKRSKMLVL